MEEQEQAADTRPLPKVALSFGLASSSLWRDRNFQLIWSGQTISIFGDRVTDIALPWLILTQTHAPFAAAAVAAARYVPMVVLGLAAGALADLVPRRALLIGCDLVRAQALLSIVLMGFLHAAPPLWQLTLVALALGLGQLGFQAAYGAWLPTIAEAGRLGRANAALEASDAASTLAGPPVGGGLIQAFGPALALGADMLSYLISAVALWRVREAAPIARRRAWPRLEPATFGRARDYALEGIHAILRSPEQRLLRGLAAALYLDAGAISVLLAALSQMTLHLTPWQAGMVFGAAGVGGLLGSALAPRALELPWRQGLLGTMLVAAMGSAGLLLAALNRTGDGFLTALLANAVLDGAVSLSFILTMTRIGLITPDAVRGRVSGVGLTFSSLVRGLGLVLLGLLAASGSPAPAFALLTLAFAVAAIAAARSSHSPDP